MHKKLFTAVLALGLLFLLSGTVIARDIPFDGAERPVNSWGSGSKTGTPVLGSLVTDPVVTVNAGTARTVPGTFCSGQYQGPLAYGINGWYAGNEFYAGYQDPADPTRFGAVCLNSPSFDVTAIRTIVGNTAGPFPFTLVIQPLVFDVASPSATPGCAQEPAPVAGGASCVGPSYAVTWNVGGFFDLQLPFTVECCQTGPYYAAWYSASLGALRIGTDRGSNAGAGQHAVTGQNFCSQWNEYGAGWLDMDQFWQANFGAAFDLTNLTFSEGYTPDDPATHCNPGECEYAFGYTTADSQFVRFEDGNDDWFTGFSLADDALSAVAAARKWGVRFDAIGLDTLKEVKVLVHEFFAGTAGPDTLELEIWGEGPATGCNGEKIPGALLYSVVIPPPITLYPSQLTIPVPDITFGTLNGGPEQSIFATMRIRFGRIGTAMGEPTTPAGTGTCIGGDFRPYSLLWYPNHLGVLGNAQWKYVGERAATAGHFEFVMEGLICREVLPAVEIPCVTPADAEWPMFAGNPQQTSASTIDVGDPQEVTLAWTNALPRINSFTSPVVANDIVYISSDQELNAYSLSTGAPVGTLAGAPEMGASNRGHATVANIAALGRDVVFATGGALQSITALEIDLETSPKIWSNNVTNFNTPNGLAAQVRFNTSKVVNIAGTDVLFVGTEPGVGAGRLWAFDAATGALYPGWATNPMVLDAGLKHGPTVNASGTKLYVATAIGGTNLNGSLRQVDAATGVVDWTTGVVGEGWPSGVSYEADMLYGASYDGTQGFRWKFDVSGVAPVVEWTAAQGVGLYGTPTIGSGFVYFPLDNPSFGLLQVDKSLGLVARNYAAENICGASIFMVPTTVTLSCDAYLFAGDRNGRWWLFSAVDGLPQWYRQFPIVTGGEIVNGTALASHSNGTDYAVVSVRQLNGTVGQVSAYQLNAGPRPRLIQCETEETVVVPLGAGPGNPHSVSDVFLNIGTAPLNFTALNIADPLPDGLSSASQNAREYRSRVASAAADFDGYNSIATPSTLTKKHRLAGLSAEMVDGEFTAADLANMAENENLVVSRRSSSRSMAASAAAIRTSAVLVGGAAVPTSLAPGGSAGLSWLYDGTGLGRGSDANDLEFDMDDPDFNYDGSPVATFHILYQGGCLFSSDTLDFNTNGSYQTIYNHGALGDDPGSTHEFNFAADANTPDADFFDGSLIIAGDSVAGGIPPDFGAQIAVDMFGNQERYVPNVAPVLGQCGFDVLSNVVLGAKRTGGCPGSPVDIHGEVITASYSDTNFAATPGTPGSSMGLDIVQTSVGAWDPLYGDFTVTRWNIINRDAVAKGPLYAGSFIDWDVNAGTDNNGIVSDVFGGYAIWSRPVGTIAYGTLNLNQPSTYSGVDASYDPQHRIAVYSNPTRVYDPAPWDMANDNKLQIVWSQLVNESPFRIVDGPGTNEDKSGLNINAPVNLAPNGTAAIHQAIFGVNAASDNPATIEANAAALAKRAARWAGFARGDVNDDGVVDLADVCWLQGGNYIYPAAYSGDVDADGDNDAADIARLLSFVSGNAGDQPAGAWRF